MKPVTVLGLCGSKKGYIWLHNQHLVNVLLSGSGAITIYRHDMCGDACPGTYIYDPKYRKLKGKTSK